MDYLLTARNVTQAQRMAQILSGGGIRAGVTRLPVGLSTQGCTYGVRVNDADYRAALSLVQRMGAGPLKVFAHDAALYREVQT